MRAQRDKGNAKPPTTKGNRRVLPRELLDSGQGKCKDIAAEAPNDSDMEISVEGKPKADPQNMTIWGHELLQPPVINATGEIATGATTKVLRKQNKQLRNNILQEQRINGQWTTHTGCTTINTNHWEGRTNTAEIREMAPQGLAQKHEAAELLADWEQFGCPTKTGRDWTFAEIQAGIDRGPHKSALKPDAIKHFTEEVANKVAKGQARVVLWDDI